MRSGLGPETSMAGRFNHYWDQLYEIFPDWQFVLYDPGDQTVLAKGHTIPVAWDGTDTGLGPGIDATVTAAFELRAAGGQPTAVSALAAEVPPRHQRRGLARVMLQAMATLAREAGLTHLIAPVRRTLKDRYPTIPMNATPAGPAPTGRRSILGCGRTHRTGRPDRARDSPTSWTSPAPSANGSRGPRMRFPETGNYVFPAGLATVHIDRDNDTGEY